MGKGRTGTPSYRHAFAAFRGEPDASHVSCNVAAARDGVGMKERRKDTRAPLATWVEITAGGRRLRASVRDLSVGGMGIGPMSRGLDGARRVVAEFPLPGISLPLELDAEVVWRDGTRLGLRFVEADGGLAELVARFVDGRLA